MIDSVDEQIARQLAKDARQSCIALAKRLKLSAATVRRRIKKLISSDSLRIVGVVSATKFGLPLSVVIALNVEVNKLGSVVKELTNLSGIGRVFLTTGRYDIIILAHFASNDSLADFLKNRLKQLEGLKDSETFICLEEGKEHYIPLP
jgi:Lrp/AsnC family transcriptional regulator for asnA, asnC and gidA